MIMIIAPIKANSTTQKILNCIGPSGYHVYEEEYICPLGGEKFKALELGTHSTMGVHLDWQPVSYMRFPVAIPVCPKNGFIIEKEKYTDKELSSRKAFIETPEYQKLYKEKHASFFLLAKQSEALQENMDNLWWYYLQATWEADACGNTSRYNQYAELVVEKANEKKAKLNKADDEYWAISIVVADMYRRTGQFELAQHQLNSTGVPSFQDAAANKFYLIAKQFMQDAITDRNQERVALKVPQDDKE